MRKLEISQQLKSGMLVLKHKPQETKQKGLCPSCNGNNIESGLMHESGEEIQISKCTDCGWYGSRIVQEDKMEKSVKN